MNKLNTINNMESLSKSEQTIDTGVKVKKKSTSKRCYICRKKLGLMSFTCKCSDKLFCVEHQLPELHNCSFDFKTDGLSKLCEKLIKVEHQKVIKI